jgi:hypothetical protein
MVSEESAVRGHAVSSRARGASLPNARDPGLTARVLSALARLPVSRRFGSGRGTAQDALVAALEEHQRREEHDGRGGDEDHEPEEIEVLAQGGRAAG